MELVHAKLNRGVDMEKTPVYQLDLVFGSPIRGPEGESIADGKTVHMGFMNGMPPADFAAGLRNLADHIDEQELEKQGG